MAIESADGQGRFERMERSRVVAVEGLLHRCQHADKLDQAAGGCIMKLFFCYEVLLLASTSTDGTVIAASICCTRAGGLGVIKSWL
jgi:hypothetical protein